MIELVVMDIAGTTVHDPDGVGSCLKVALASQGVHPTNEAVIGVMGIPKPVAIRELLLRFATSLKDTPQAACYETVSTKAIAEGRYIRMIEGAGRYGHCWIEIEPLSTGSGFLFESKVVNGSIPERFVPAVEMGIREGLLSGPLKGYPVADVKVSLLEGSYHEGNSNEDSFKQAALVAFRKAITNANPVVKETERASAEPDPEQIREIFLDFQKRMIDYYRTSPDVREIEGASEVFRTLKANGIKVALDTGFDRSIVDVLLERLGWTSELIDATATSDEVARGRPYPDLIRLVMQRTGVYDPANVAKVGDTPSDLGEGTAAGCKFVIGVTTGGHTAEQLREHPHTHILGSIRELPGLLGV